MQTVIDAIGRCSGGDERPGERTEWREAGRKRAQWRVFEEKGCGTSADKPMVATAVQLHLSTERESEREREREREIRLHRPSPTFVVQTPDTAAAGGDEARDTGSVSCHLPDHLSVCVGLTPADGQLSHPAPLSVSHTLTRSLKERTSVSADSGTLKSH